MATKPEMWCTDCKESRFIKDVFCYKCGLKLVKKPTCPKCGRLLFDYYHFCPSCGTIIERIK